MTSVLRLVLLLVVAVILGSCASGSNVSGHIEGTDSKPLTTEEILSNPDYVERLEFFQKYQTKILESVKIIGSPELLKIGEFYENCNVMVPVKEGAKYLTGNDSLCQIVVAKDSDSQFDVWRDYVNQDEFFAMYDSSTDFIFIEIPAQRVDDEYITAVLIHEAVHAIWRNNCSPNDFDCRANDEAIAYLIEFAYMDYLGNLRSGSRYSSYIRSESEELIETYLSDGSILYPNWEVSSEYSVVREFFQSSDDTQDKRWYSLLWMRKYQEGFFREFGSENGYRLFVQLISSVYY